MELLLFDELFQEQILYHLIYVASNPVQPDACRHRYGDDPTENRRDHRHILSNVG